MPTVVMLNVVIECCGAHGYASTKLHRFTTGKDAKRAILLAEETQSDIESAFYKEAVAKKYASFFQSTLHHNNGYFLQVKKTIDI
jgi:hypothetical protein